jgi:hypothetical protein
MITATLLINWALIINFTKFKIFDWGPFKFLGEVSAMTYPFSLVSESRSETVAPPLEVFGFKIFRNGRNF